MALAFATAAILLFLGLLREIVLLRQQVAAVSDLVTEPPVPDYIGRLTPDHLQKLVIDASDHVFLFVSEGCPSCEQIMAELIARNVGRTSNVARLRMIVLGDVSRNDTRTMLDRLERSCGWTQTVDSDGTISAACKIYGTPTAVLVSNSIATEYVPGVTAEWVVTALENGTRARPKEVQRT